jgi:hypothetical protein
MRNLSLGISLRAKIVCLLFCVTVLDAGCPPHHVGTVDFGKLKPTQLKLLNPSPDLQRQRWNSLNPSEQLEFAGVTQALDDYYQHLLLLLRLEHPPALEEVLAVKTINGSIPSGGSAAQFNLEVSWKGGAKELFHQDKTHWWTHLSWLHPGDHGYTQIRYWDPFLGLVVLFDDQDVTKGQIHIDFRDLIWHYFPDNGNIAANYDYYCDWYGPLNGYSVTCPPENKLSQRLSSSAGLRKTAPPETPEVTGHDAATPTGSELRVDESAMNAVNGLLNAWYKEREFSTFLKYLSSDNFYARTTLNQMQAEGYSASRNNDFEKSWKDIFDGAFTSPSAGRSRFRGEVTQELTFPRPSLAPEARSRLNFIEAPGNKENQLKVLDPLSAPDGALFPPLTLSSSEKNKFDAVAWYLDYLYRKYAQKRQLFVVGYATNEPSLVREGGVQYWIYKDGKWGLAFFHGTD